MSTIVMQSYKTQFDHSATMAASTYWSSENRFRIKCSLKIKQADFRSQCECFLTIQVNTVYLLELHEIVFDIIYRIEHDKQNTDKNI